MTARNWLLLMALAGAAGGYLACSYDPHYQSGVTKCADATSGKRCPDGFVCDAPTGSPGVCVTAASDGGAGTDGGPPASGGSGGHSGIGGGQPGAGGTPGSGGATGVGTGGTTGTGTGGKTATGTGGAGTGTGGASAGSGGAGAGTGGKTVTGTGGAGTGGVMGTGGGKGGAGGGAVTGTMTVYHLAAGTHPYRITAVPGGDLWFVEAGASKIGRMTTAGTLVNEYATPTASSGPYDIVYGPGAFISFIESIGYMGRLDLTTAVITEIPLPDHTTASGPFSLAVGSDNNLWYADYGGDGIGRVTPASGTNGVASATYWPTGNGSDPIDIAAGPDGNLWFTNFSSGKIGQITPTGTITSFPVTTADSLQAVTSDKGSNLWLLEDMKAARVTAATGAVTEYPLVDYNSSGADITLNSDGNLWFTNGANKVGRLTPGGVATTYTVTGMNAAASGIVAGPDGNLWFTDSVQNNIIKIAP